MLFFNYFVSFPNMLIFEYYHFIMKDPKLANKGLQNIKMYFGTGNAHIT